jgi:hypothetical protein
MYVRITSRRFLAITTPHFFGLLFFRHHQTFRSIVIADPPPISINKDTDSLQALFFK